MRADIREPKEITDKLGWEVVELPAGDYEFTTKNGRLVIIERKAGPDIFQLKRLIEELKKIKSNADFGYLLIEGMPSMMIDEYLSFDRKPTQYKYTSFSNLLCTIQEQGIKLLFSPSIQATPKVINSLYSYWQKEKHQAFQRAYKVKVDEDIRVNILSQIPGIDAVLAKRLIEKFGSLKAVFNAKSKELTEVEGIGKKKARKILNTLKF